MKKLISILVISILVISMGIFNVYAEEDTPICELEFKKSAESIAPGGVIELTLAVSNIQGNGIAGVSGVMEYNPDLFEKVEYEDTTNWEKPALIDSAIDVFTKSLSNEKDDQDVFKMILTTKESISTGNYDVKLKNIEITTEDDVYTIDDVEAKIVIKEATKPSSDDDKNTTNTNTNKNTTNTNTNKNTTNTNTDKNTTNTNKTTENTNTDKNTTNTNGNKSTSNTSGNSGESSSSKETSVKEASDPTSSEGSKSLPKTGIAAGIGIGIIAVAVAALIFYFKYDKYKSVK